MSAHRKEAVFFSPRANDTVCEVHDWPTEDLPRRLIKAMRERHGRGGIDVCHECLKRARDEAKRNDER